MFAEGKLEPFGVDATVTQLDVELPDDVKLAKFHVWFAPAEPSLKKAVVAKVKELPTTGLVPVAVKIGCARTAVVDNTALPKNKLSSSFFM